MPTRTGSGSSTLSGNAGAAAAVREAAATLGDARAQTGFVFVSPDRDLAATLATARSVSPGTSFIGCTTAGELTERGLTHGGVAALLVASDELATTVAAASGIAANPTGAAAGLCRDYASTAAGARERGFGLSTTVVLTDGLGAAEGLVDALEKSVRFGARIVGAGAGDEGQLKKTIVAGEGLCGPDGAAAIHFFGRRLWGVGVGHGLRPNSAPMRVTRATGNVVHELDGRPAIEQYRTHAARSGIELGPTTLAKFLLENELGLFAGGELYRVRAPLAVTPDGSLAFAGTVPAGSTACLMTGGTSDLLGGVRSAAAEARATLGGHAAAGVLLFSCICRGSLLGPAYDSEIEAVRDAFPGVPIAGFLSYGEIARYQGGLEGFHNNTVVIAAIPA